ncbi:hypothetical protein JCM10914_3316 [Paenibacillus sp. JCM 10914]|nr:hypothetical protein JCM10914_3316 [Paenibacillus sp. JCM 10914]
MPKVQEQQTEGISIHAPIQGATIDYRTLYDRLKISIHAPIQGATKSTQKIGTNQGNFNPRTHTGCDWSFTRMSPGWYPYFNPRTHTGCDKLLRIGPLPVLNFNPRTHTGCDIQRQKVARYCSYFNPRTHTGCDADANGGERIDGTFQSTHPYRVRRFHLHSTWLTVISIHAPIQGATFINPSIQLFMTYFNPRTHTGCDLPKIEVVAMNVNFNPRTHTGCDGIPGHCQPRYLISIHAPIQGATNRESNDYRGA